jgi:mandelamide amidase
MDPIDTGVGALRTLLEDGTLSSVALVERLVERTRAAASLNVWTAFDADRLREAARAADARRAAGERLPLLGIPVALKDNVDAVGFPCAAGTGALAGAAPTRDAEVVRRLREAGALIAGKVGLHELAFGITSNNRVSGAVRNPWDPARIPGGSSGGSGAAVAAGLVPAAIGTDTGGSVRVPAALCGVAGLRPTVGRVPGAGIVPISTTRDTAGPLALRVADLALLDAVLAADATPLPATRLAGLRLGVPRAHFWEDLEPGTREVAEAALEAIRAAGAVPVEVDLPGLAQANGAAGFPIALFEFVRDMTRYLAERRPGVGFEALLAGIGSPDVAAIARPLAGAGAIPEPVYREALEARRRLQAIYADAFAGAGVEALVFPTVPRTAARIGEDDEVELNGRRCPTFPTFIRNTDPGSNAGLPGISLPAGLSGGLPVGLALDGPRGTDRRLLAIAAAIEALLPPATLAPSR